MDYIGVSFGLHFHAPWRRWYRLWLGRHKAGCDIQRGWFCVEVNYYR